jgi:hypothetical protein
MSDRIDQYLKGTLSRDELDPSEHLEADAADRAVSDTRAFLAARPAPDVMAGVMQRVTRSASPGPPIRAGIFIRVARLLWMPRQISIRPAYAVAAAGVLLAMLVFIVPSILMRTTDPTSQLYVQFRLQTAAANVQLAGSFTNWQPTYQLHQVSPGVWTITVPLPQGVHDYAFVVNGQEWVADPYAPGIDDGFGGTNSRLTLLLPDTPRL